MEGAKDIAKHETNIHEAYDILEIYLGNSEFVAGSQVSYNLFKLRRIFN